MHKHAGVGRTLKNIIKSDLEQVPDTAIVFGTGLGAVGAGAKYLAAPAIAEHVPAAIISGTHGAGIATGNSIGAALASAYNPFIPIGAGLVGAGLAVKGARAIIRRRRLKRLVADYERWAAEQAALRRQRRVRMAAVGALLGTAGGSALVARSAMKQPAADD